MDDKKFASACQQVYRQFPEMQGISPRVQSYGENGESFLLIFQTRATTANGKSINRIVRAVVSQQGKLIKVTTSRG